MHRSPAERQQAVAEPPSPAADQSTDSVAGPRAAPALTGWPRWPPLRRPAPGSASPAWPRGLPPAWPR
eukprot:8246461-Pyramimonas_sp.AAC.1